jgi:hypothetical protein
VPDVAPICEFARFSLRFYCWHAGKVHQCFIDCTCRCEKSGHLSTNCRAGNSIGKWILPVSDLAMGIGRLKTMTVAPVTPGGTKLPQVSIGSSPKNESAGSNEFQKP